MGINNNNQNLNIIQSIDQIIDQIKNQFINFYGIDYFEMINDRLKTLTGIIPYSKKENKKFTSLKEYLDYYQIINYNEEIINKKIPFYNEVLEKNCPAMVSYLNDDNLKTIIYFPRHIDKHYHCDCTLIHEMLHALEEHLIIKDDNLIVSQGGFETMTLKGDKPENRDYELLNEILHEEISQDITNDMHSRGIYLCNTPEETIKSQEEYSRDECIVIKKFYLYFKKEILECKLFGNVDNFIDIVDKEKFIKFKEWVYAYYNLYPTVKERIARKENNDLRHADMINKGLEIVTDMINSLIKI